MSIDQNRRHSNGTEAGGSPMCWNGHVEYDDIVDVATAIKQRLNQLERQDWHCLVNPLGAGVAFTDHGIDGHPVIRTMMRLRAMSDELQAIEDDTAEYTGGNQLVRWTKACRWDGCESKAFVCFSHDNPYAGGLRPAEWATIPPSERPALRAEGFVAVHPDAKHVIGEPSVEGEPCA